LGVRSVRPVKGGWSNTPGPNLVNGTGQNGAKGRGKENEFNPIGGTVRAENILHEGGLSAYKLWLGASEGLRIQCAARRKRPQPNSLGSPNVRVGQSM